MHPCPQTETAFALVVEHAARLGSRLVCFDFGGTLFDFAPLHRRAFLTVLGIEAASVNGAIATRVLDDTIAKGVDSFAMLDALAGVLPLANVDRQAIVESKRLVVEQYLASQVLDKTVSASLQRLRRRVSVAVFSLGLVSSMKAVLQRSIGAEAEGIGIYGRLTTAERTDKRQLVERLLRDADMQAQDALLVGDAEVDELIARSLGTAWLRLRPFRESH